MASKVVEEPSMESYDRFFDFFTTQKLLGGVSLKRHVISIMVFSLDE